MFILIGCSKKNVSNNSIDTLSKEERNAKIEQSINELKDTEDKILVEDNVRLTDSGHLLITEDTDLSQTIEKYIYINNSNFDYSTIKYVVYSLYGMDDNNNMVSYSLEKMQDLPFPDCAYSEYLYAAQNSSAILVEDTGMEQYLLEECDFAYVKYTFKDLNTQEETTVYTLAQVLRTDEIGNVTDYLLVKYISKQEHNLTVNDIFAKCYQNITIHY
jgi:hypothetical protein